MKDLTLFKHKTNEHVRYNDLDTLGHVNNARYLSYLEESRISYFEDALQFDKTQLDFQAVVGTVNIKYMLPVNYGDSIELYTRCSRIGKKSLDFETLVVKKTPQAPNTPILAAESVVTLVSYNEKTKQAAEHRPETLQKIREFEKNNDL